MFVIFILILIIAHDLKLSKKCKNLCIFSKPCQDTTLYILVIPPKKDFDF